MLRRVHLPEIVNGAEHCPATGQFAVENLFGIVRRQFVFEPPDKHGPLAEAALPRSFVGRVDYFPQRDRRLLNPGATRRLEDQADAGLMDETSGVLDGAHPATLRGWRAEFRRF